jgi:alkylation response protein AidB-like acyl-CoA dehydrogenase
VTWVGLTEEQRMLADTAARMVADHPTLADAQIEQRRAAGDLWRSMVARGLVGLVVSDDSDDDSDGDEPTLNAALVIEQLARGVSAVPYLGTVLALGLLGASAPHGAEVDEILAGRPGCVVVDPTLSRLARRGIAVDAGPGALAVGMEGHVVWTAELGPRLDSLDLSRPLVTAGDGGTALGEISPEAGVRWQAQALALLCADLVGTCAGALEGAVAHARARQQFGRPIGSFQAVQQLCADQLVSVEGCRSITWHAAWAVDALAPDQALAQAQIAKAFCSDVARTVCEAAIQVWGGLGMTWECPAHRYLRRALLDRQLLGDERVQLGAIVQDRLVAAATKTG